MNLKDQFIVDTLLECLGKVSIAETDTKRAMILIDYYEKLDKSNQKPVRAKLKQIIKNTNPSMYKGYFPHG